MENPFFSPRAIAVVGASPHADSVGGGLFRNLLVGGASRTSRETGFPGPVHGVNLHGGTAHGEVLHPDLAALPGPVDLVIVAVPAAGVAALMDDAVRAGARGLVVLSAGFAELGTGGARAQRELCERARAAGLRMIGPNCVGLLRPSRRLNASFAQELPSAGPVALVSQSGALISAWLSQSEGDGAGLSFAVSLGDKADVADHEVLLWLEEDEETRVIALYLESLPEAQAVVSCVKRIARRKPVIVLQGGVTAAGAAAARSHTGALVGRPDALRGALTQAGAIVVPTLRELRAASYALAGQRRIQQRSVAILTNAGGLGVLAADEALRTGFELTRLSVRTEEQLQGLVPLASSRTNPMDVLGDAPPARICEALRILQGAGEVDTIVLLCTSQVMTRADELAQSVAALQRAAPAATPLVVCAPGWSATRAARCFTSAGIPLTDDPSAAFAILRILAAAPRDRGTPEPCRIPPALLAECPAPGPDSMDLSQSRAWLRAAGFPMGAACEAATAVEAGALAEKLGFPVVLKAVCPGLHHKSDLGGVQLNLASATHVEACATDMRQRLSAHLDTRELRYVVERQLYGRELIVGAFRDEDLGTLLLFGVGGTWVERLRDTSLRCLPLGRDELEDMIDELRLASWVRGERGQPGLPIDELCDLAARCTAAFEVFDALVEIELNPVLVTERGLVAVDARVNARRGRRDT